MYDASQTPHSSSHTSFPVERQITNPQERAILDVFPLDTLSQSQRLRRLRRTRLKRLESATGSLVPIYRSLENRPRNG